MLLSNRVTQCTKVVESYFVERNHICIKSQFEFVSEPEPNPEGHQIIHPTDAEVKTDVISPKKQNIECDGLAVTPVKQSRMSGLPRQASTPSPSKKAVKQKDSGKLKMENIQMGKEPELTRRRPVRQSSRSKLYGEMEVGVYTEYSKLLHCLMHYAVQVPYKITQEKITTGLPSSCC